MPPEHEMEYDPDVYPYLARSLRLKMQTSQFRQTPESTQGVAPIGRVNILKLSAFSAASSVRLNRCGWS